MGNDSGRNQGNAEIMITNFKVKFAFFGSSRFSTLVLDELEKNGVHATCVVTSPDKPQGRKMELTPNEVKQWAKKRNIKIFDPIKHDQKFVEQIKKENCELFIVASFGRIIPQNVLGLPKFKILNIHPSLLPDYRGASPLQSAMLEDRKNTGVTIMKIDNLMDHGPIIAQKSVQIDEWPIYEKFEEIMAVEGTKLLIDIIPEWISGKIIEKEQNHALASYTKKIIKNDGLIDFSQDEYKNFRKIQAFHAWPQAFFFIAHNDKQIRVKITKADFKEGKLLIERVIPEGSKEMNYEDFMKGYE